MATNYPSALDDTTVLKNDAANETTTPTTHRASHNNLADAIIAIQTELGALPKGSFADVAARLAGVVNKSVAAAQTIMPTADVIPLALRAHASQAASGLLEIQESDGSPVIVWSRTGAGGLESLGLRVSGTPLAVSHLTDGASVLKDPSPSITTPTLSSPTFTGDPTAPTAAVDTNTTQVATTAYVKNQGYIIANSPSLTGNPTAPTPSVGDESTKIATTAFVVAEIIDREESSIPSGALMPWATNSAPTGYLMCDGSAVSRTTYANLFGAIGTAYGAGDGSTTFNVPDLRGRMAVGKGTHADVDALGDNDGTAQSSRTAKHSHGFSLSTNDAGSHTHGSSWGSAGSHSHTGTSVGGTTQGGGSGVAVVTSWGGVGSSSAGSHAHSVSFSGGSHSDHAITGTVGTAGMTDGPAYLVLNYVIKT
jgi:microcystin-dependent protein